MMLLFTFTLINIMGFPTQSFQIYGGDTINKVDANNMKQEKWIYFGNMVNLPEYKPEQKVEEGKYRDNRKEGMWVKYFPNDKIMSEITFASNRPMGEYKIYYDNGSIQEQGVWKNNRNTGTFKRFHENGQPQQDFTFNETGKREGTQKYFHENGQVMIVGNWNEGKENGELKEYYANGDLKSVKVFNAGGMDEAKTQAFEPKKPDVKLPEIKTEVPVKETEVVQIKEEKPNEAIGVFNGEGNHTLYNKNRLPSQKGFFEKGRLKDGTKFIYDKDGILVKKEVYKKFRYVGEAPLEEEDSK